MGFLAALGPIISWIGSNAAVISSVASTAATIGTSVAAANRPEPKIEAPTAAPEAAQATAAVATERKQLQQKAGYRSTLLTNQLSQYSANPGGKTLLGQ